MSVRWFLSLFAFLILGLGSFSVWAQNVTITPLGAAQGEFCVGDRALLFEDPTGVRVLIAPGRTVNGSGDGRLPDPAGETGGVHVLLIDHPHVDHIGDVFHNNCAGSASTPFAFPSEGNAPEIAAGHKSAVLVGGELPDFFTQKISNVSPSFAALTAAQKGCPAVGLDNTLLVPSTARVVNNACVGVIRGGTRTATMQGANKGVKITTIPAFHAAGASRLHVDELTGPGGATVADPGVPAGLTGYAGSETGYIIRFTNGLSVLWTGDSGLIGDWATQAKFYGVNLAVVHGGDLFTMGPDEAAFAVNELIKPRSVIPEHFNQVSTNGGKVNPGTRLARFIQQLKGQASTRVIVPLSGTAISCDGQGNCK
jgi:L-ascorbate metabolism protein UlaG (beta-lactamase superfamily)